MIARARTGLRNFFGGWKQIFLGGLPFPPPRTPWRPAAAVAASGKVFEKKKFLTKNFFGGGSFSLLPLGAPLPSSTWGPFEALGPLRGPFGALGAPSGPLRGLRPFGPRLRPRPSGALNDLGQTNKAFYLDELRIGWISIGQHVSVYSAVVLGYSKAYYYRKLIIMDSLLLSIAYYIRP